MKRSLLRGRRSLPSNESLGLTRLRYDASLCGTHLGIGVGVFVKDPALNPMGSLKAQFHGLPTALADQMMMEVVIMIFRHWRLPNTRTPTDSESCKKQCKKLHR
ncbi:hypothetical protein K474DRAFT_1662306 [Panus rudis PR-1116 ss-1]|nr:hypothetical protein K474DRAFT_1662306 [Panus rudis PR-1116 ss-1]